MWKENQNKDLHMFSSNLICNWLIFCQLQNNAPRKDVSSIPYSVFIPTLQEYQRYFVRSKVIIGRILIEFLPAFFTFKKCLPSYFKHAYTNQMAQKSQIISMSIINANESSYKDCVEILSTKHRNTAWLDFYKFLMLPSNLFTEPASVGQVKAHWISLPMIKWKIWRSCLGVIS